MRVPFIKLSLVLSLLTACGRDSSAAKSTEADASQPNWSLLARRVGELQGYAALDSLLRQRLFDPSDARSSAFSVAAIGGEAIYELRQLLGAYAEGSTIHHFENGQANPFNSMLWFNQMQWLALKIAGACPAAETLPTDEIQFKILDKLASFRLHPELLQTLQRLCLGNERSDLEALWLQLQSYDAPYAEQLAWVQHMETYPVSGPAEERLADALLTILLNPYFLLQK